MLKSRKLMYMIFTILSIIGCLIASKHITIDLIKECLYWIGMIGTAAVTGQSAKDLGEKFIKKE